MIYPAIDLMDGGCVRLFKGDFDQRTDYAASPLDVAAGYARDGARWMHMVDLDGAKDGDARQTDLIAEIATKTPLKIQTGGGIRSAEHVATLLDAGVERVVIGSLAVTNPDLVMQWMSEFGSANIVLALDVNMGADGLPYPAIKGWTEPTETTLWDVLAKYKGSGLKTILVTDIGRDGVQSGGNIALYREIQARYPNVDLITSGGVGTLDHVKALKAINPAGIIIGKALYEGNFSLSEAIAC